MFWKLCFKEPLKHRLQVRGSPAAREADPRRARPLPLRRRRLDVRVWGFRLWGLGFMCRVWGLGFRL